MRADFGRKSFGRGGPGRDRCGRNELGASAGPYIPPIGLGWFPVEQGRDLLTLLEHHALCTTGWAWWSGWNALDVAEGEDVARLVDTLEFSYGEGNAKCLLLAGCAAIEEGGEGL